MPISKIIKECAICGRKHEYEGPWQRLPDNYFKLIENPDLDYRQHYLDFAVDVCDACGYAYDDIEFFPLNPSKTVELLESEKYLQCNGLSFSSDLAKYCYQKHLVCLVDKEIDKAAYAMLYAAWACDDAGDKELAVHCRKEAEKLFSIYMLEEKIVSQYGYYSFPRHDLSPEEAFKYQRYTVIRVDLLRRSGQFEKVIKEFEGRHCSDERETRIVAFQVYLAKQNDVAPHKVSEAVAWVEEQVKYYRFKLTE